MFFMKKIHPKKELMFWDAGGGFGTGEHIVPRGDGRVPAEMWLWSSIAGIAGRRIESEMQGPCLAAYIRVPTLLISCMINQCVPARASCPASKLFGRSNKSWEPVYLFLQLAC